MGVDLSLLREKKEAYVKEQAEKIAKSMVDNGWTTFEKSTCDHYNWDQELHRNMPQIASELRNMGIDSSSSVKWGVTDWVFTIIN